MSCLSLGPGERGEHTAGETSGGSTEEIIASTSPTELAPRWEHGRWGPEDPAGKTGVRREAGKAVVGKVRSQLQSPPLGFAAYCDWKSVQRGRREGKDGACSS